MLPVIVARPALMRSCGEIVQANVESRQRADVSNSAAHLASADHTHRFDLDTHLAVASERCRH